MVLHGAGFAPVWRDSRFRVAPASSSVDNVAVLMELHHRQHLAIYADSLMMRPLSLIVTIRGRGLARAGMEERRFLARHRLLPLPLPPLHVAQLTVPHPV